MRVLGGGYFAAAALLLCSQPSYAFRLCADHVPRDQGLYLLENGSCWSEVKNLGLSEGTLYVKDIPKYAPRSQAQFAYLMSQPSSYRTAVVIKERIYRPSAIFDREGKLRAENPPVSDVLLKRAAVQSVCDQKDDLDRIAQRLNRESMKINVNVYNRYHTQPLNFIPISDELKEFHFKYPVNLNCVETNSSSNRIQYVLRGGLRIFSPTIPIISWIANLITSADAENLYYAKLKVQNVYVDGSETFVDSSKTYYSVVRYNAEGRIGTRLEITISDLENRSAWPFQATTWQIEWGQ